MVDENNTVEAGSNTENTAQQDQGYQRADEQQDDDETNENVESNNDIQDDPLIGQPPENNVFFLYKVWNDLASSPRQLAFVFFVLGMMIQASYKVMNSVVFVGLIMQTILCMIYAVVGFASATYCISQSPIVCSLINILNHWILSHFHSSSILAIQLVPWNKYSMQNHYVIEHVNET